MSCAELTSWTNMSLLEKRENLASFFHVIKGKRPGLSPPWFSWQIQGGRILRGSARGGDSEEGRSGFCAGDAPRPCQVSARPAQAPRRGRRRGARTRGSTPRAAAASQLCVLANRVRFLCPSSLLCKQGEGPFCLCGKSSQTWWLKTTDPSPLPALEPEV